MRSNKLKPLVIGDITIEHPLALAPMAGVTDLPYRLLCKEQGAGMMCTEMVSAKGLYYGNRKSEPLMATDPKEIPIAIQIFGSDPEIMGQMAAKVNDGRFQMIDINMGCPVPKIVNNGDGSALMKNPELAGKVIKAVVDAVDIPVIAAGGIADGRGFMAAMALGASGVQIGTRFLTAKECPVHENYKLALIKAKDTDTVVTGRSVGVPVRCLKNPMTREYIALEKKGVSAEELEYLTLGSLRKAVLEGDTKSGSVMAGQVAGMLSKVQSVSEIIEDITNHASEVFKNLEVM